jgi:mRNA-degrading endonuclease YafQ of YafQ-DinJ toxin-antitoxin module
VASPKGMGPSKPHGKFTLIWTNTFLRTARKFIQRHPEYDVVLEDVLKQIEKDPFVPRLKLHPLQGKHKDKHAVSLSYEYRIVLTLKLTAKEIILLDIGTHDEVYH